MTLIVNIKWGPGSRATGACDVLQPACDYRDFRRRINQDRGKILLRGRLTFPAARAYPSRLERTRCRRSREINKRLEFEPNLQIGNFSRFDWELFPDHACLP